MIRVELKEFGLSAPLPIGKGDIPRLRQRLQDKAEVVFDIDGVKLKAKSYVGYIPITGDTTLVVRPKIETIEDLFYIVGRADMSPAVWDSATFAMGVTASDRDSVPEFVTKAFLAGLRALKRDGIYRRAVVRSENRSIIKGKIDITRTVRGCIARGVMGMVHCEHHEPTADTLENRFIKYTIWHLLHTKGLAKPIQNDLRAFWRDFTHIPLCLHECYVAEVGAIISRHRLPSSRSYYMNILSNALLIISSLTPVVEMGSNARVNAFAIKMDDAFERYTRNVLKEALQPNLVVLNGNLDKKKLFSDADRPDITPDIMICDASRCLLVADTKYKDVELPKAEDWYQIAAYILALSVSIGVLVCGSASVRPPQAFHIGDKTLWVYFLPLQQPKQHEQGLVEFMLERVDEERARTTIGVSHAESI